MAKKSYSNGPKKKVVKKSTRAGVSKMGTKKGSGTIKAKTAKGKETNRGDKDGRMAGARQDALNKRVKKAGGADAYMKKTAKTKSGLVKVGSVYRRKKK